MSKSPVYIGAGSTELSVLAALDLISTASTASDDLAVFQSLFHGSLETEPSSNVSDGDLWFDTSVGVDAMRVYSSTTSSWELISPTASEQTNIDTVAADAVDIGKVADIDGDVTIEAGLGTNGVDVTTVAGKATEIGRLGTADAVADMVLLGTTAIADPTTGDLKLVADIHADVTTVAGKATEIGLLGTEAAIADMALLGTSAVVADMDLLGATGVISNITIVGDDLSTGTFTNIFECGGIDEAVSGSAGTSDISAVADIDTDVTTVAGISANVTTVAGVSANVTTVATNIATVNDFADKYRIASSAPGSDNNDGDLYYNTVTNQLNVHDGSNWGAIGLTEVQTQTEANNAAVAMSIALG